MPLHRYGVLKGRAVRRRLAVASSPHYQLMLTDGRTDWRVAINVRSKSRPSEVEYVVETDFRHPVTDDLPDLPPGFRLLERRPGGLALDFIRGNLFDRRRLRPLPFDRPGPRNDLNELLDASIRLALADAAVEVYAFGERWGPERHQPDRIFGFQPGNGIHDIHMNQGNAPPFVHQNGAWQDGALFLHVTGERRWIAVFLKFQSQTWHTDDATGRRIDPLEPHLSGPTDQPLPGEPDLAVRIVAALVHPLGGEPEAETVTLLNASPEPVDLTGWALTDRLKHRQTIDGVIPPGATRVVALRPPVQLSNTGGTITLLDADGLKVHGVAYSRQPSARAGWTIVF
jgi:uncharacterized protein YukJ